VGKGGESAKKGERLKIFLAQRVNFLDWGVFSFAKSGLKSAIYGIHIVVIIRSDSVFSKKNGMLYTLSTPCGFPLP